MSDYLNTALDATDAEAFERQPEICPICSTGLAVQEDGAHEYECGAFLVREVDGPIWKVACPHDPESERSAA